MVSGYQWPFPTSDSERDSILTQIDASGDGAAFEALSIPYGLRAMVRDEHGKLEDVWLPYAGKFWYYAHHTQPESYELTSEAREGVATWTIDFECSILSLFRPTNAPVLAQVRSWWKQWLEDHPDLQASTPDEDELEESNADGIDDEVLTLAEPPSGTPLDNSELSERNVPELQEAVAQWQTKIGHTFNWAL